MLSLSVRRFALHRRCCATVSASSSSAALLAHSRSFSTPGKVTVKLRTSDGTPVSFEAPAGMTLMEAVRDVAELFVEVCCSGTMQCASCHVHVAPEWAARAGAPSEQELDTLDQALDVRDTSRLACQIRLTEELNGIEVELPKETVNLVSIDGVGPLTGAGGMGRGA